MGRKAKAKQDIGMIRMIERRRVELELTISSVCIRSKVPLTTYSYLILGQYENVSLDSLLRICKTLNINVKTVTEHGQESL